MFQETNSAVAEEVQKSLKRHLWYLTAECVVFAFFDKDLPDEIKQEMANTLLQHERPAVFSPQKPVFPPTELLDESSLSIYVGPRSWLLFELLHHRGDWLHEPISDWENFDEYLKMAQVVAEIAVVNDTAERGVKDIEDYANKAKDGVKRQNMVLVSNSHRSKIPEFKKNEMENEL